MKILISAYSCETGRGSEGEIGWRMVHALASQHDVRVITRANLRDVHSESFSDSPKPPNLHFEYFDLPWIFRFYKRGNRGFLLYYYLWQIGVGLRARAILNEEPADVLHHLIGGMDWMPAGLALCPGPFVWGPVGSENTHPIILRHLPVQSRLKSRIRIAIRWALRTLEPFTRLTGARAAVVLSHTPETMPQRYAKRLKPFTQTGIVDLPTLARPKKDFNRRPVLKIVFAGELKDWKGARMALDASLAYLDTGASAELVVLGDGPLRNEMEAITTTHPKGDQVRFLGKVPMLQLIDELHSADLFLYPSFHHGLATVVLQAMLTGLPIVCIEGDATGRVVEQEAGITVKLSKHEAPAVGLARAIRELAQCDERRQSLARAARQIALERFSYETHASRLEAIYAEVSRRT